ncbi:MAG: hypothetical protein M1820_007854 [Bogoriella megaspora]|nr:MAG: hypothetical protein M1820_007854 [Bogoriella megaspora]
MTCSRPDYQAAVAKGDARWSELEARLLSNDGDTIPPFDFDDGYVNSFSDERPPINAELWPVVRDQISMANWEYSIITTHEVAGEAPYINYFNTIAGGIFCCDNDKGYDTNDPKYNFSDILFAGYEQCAVRQGQSVSNLRQIWRMHIRNSGTLVIIRAAAQYGSPVDRGEYLEYFPDQSGFKALLGTPNGYAFVGLLKDHALALGRKTIESIRVRDAGDAVMMWATLHPFEAPVQPITPQKQQRRRAKNKQSKEQYSSPSSSNTVPFQGFG